MIDPFDFTLIGGVGRWLVKSGRKRSGHLIGYVRSFGGVGRFQLPEQIGDRRSIHAAIIAARSQRIRF